ncbi:hypothetical protein [Sutcliffiella rhizosphaerae]|uniref:Lipoprotein n=1 Tax=Sutcliffiella rhizosphaerae TaxID=2880967 RepID=A0ABM8YP31_9BACI|nr:hypothetical protein [Sutcliffiella rhizosphaerae]CAG9621761.1 hypothetical protein BACCIP111883_02534 [Sutcliffiella rhizosphaerae]
MKKNLSSFFIFIMCIQLLGCSYSEDTTIPDENTFLINFVNKSNIEFQGIEVSYYQKGTYRGSANIGYASEKEKVRKGDVLPLDFNKHNFILDEEVEFEVTIIIDRRENEKLMISSPIKTMLASLKSVYYLEINEVDKKSITIK